MAMRTDEVEKIIFKHNKGLNLIEQTFIHNLYDDSKLEEEKCPRKTPKIGPLHQVNLESSAFKTITNPSVEGVRYCVHLKY